MERVWKRMDFPISNLSINPLNPENVELDLTKLFEDIKKDNDVVKSEARIPAAFMESEEKFEEFFNENDKMQCIKTLTRKIFLTCSPLRRDLIDAIFKTVRMPFPVFCKKT